MITYTVSEETIAALVRNQIITVDPKDAEKCCGGERDEDGLCRYRPGQHPAYVRLLAGKVW